MKFTTELYAVDLEERGKNRLYVYDCINKFQGPHIEAISFEHAEEVALKEYGSYLRVTGRLIEEVDEDTGDITNFENNN